MTNTSLPATAAPTYRRAFVQNREITHDPAFAVRGLQCHHIRTLLIVLRQTGRLEPILLWDDRRDPERHRLVLLDGQHRAAAYANHRRNTKVAKSIPARIVCCDEVTAHRLAAQRNSRDKLPLTFAEKMNLAWRLVWLADAKLSKADIVGDTGVSRTTVHNMRQRRKAMIAAEITATGEWWRDSRDDTPGKPEETDMEAKIKAYAETFMKPAEAMRRETAEVKWDVMERVFGSYEARQFAYYGLTSPMSEFMNDGITIERVSHDLEDGQHHPF
jgi:hypothetical protein